jgi:cytoskeletal protein RodZ
MLTGKKDSKSGEGYRNGSLRDDTEREGAGGRERVSHLLRQERERRNLSLGEVAQRTHIPLPYLQLLEGMGNERAVPDPLYLIAPLQAYAAFLQVELGSALTDFITEVEQLPVVAEQGGRGMRLLHLLPSFPERPSAFAPGSLFLLLTLGSLVAVVHYSGQTWAVRPTAQTEPPLSAPSSPPSASEAWPPQSVSPPGLLSSPADVDQSEPPSVPPAVSPPITAALPVKPSVASVPQVEAPVVHAPLQALQSPGSALHRLRVRAKAKTWLQLTVDGHPMKRVVLDSGHSQEWVAKKGFTLSVGNAGAVKLTLDGGELPPLGKAGQRALNIRLPSPRGSQEQEVRQAARPRVTKPR